MDDQDSNSSGSFSHQMARSVPPNSGATTQCFAADNSHTLTSPSSVRTLSAKRNASETTMPSYAMGLSGLSSVQHRFTPTGSRLSGVPSSISSFSMKRPFLTDYAFDFNAVRKFPRSGDKSKGLRHFSTKVCEKVKEKGQTNYNEVADELVTEYFDSADVPLGDSEKQQYDMKNIRRRVYDALNVLMAMNIIEKEKKEIRWVGLPTSSLQECRKLEEEKIKRLEQIHRKSEQLQELIIQLVAYKSLVERNRELERSEGRPTESSILYLPFIVVNTAKKTLIDCAISHDKTEYLFNFDQPFEIHDDIEVLKRLGLAHGLERSDISSDEREKVKSYLPLALRDYIDQIADGNTQGDQLEGETDGTIASGSREKQPVSSPASVVKNTVINSAGNCKSVARIMCPMLPRSAATNDRVRSMSNTSYSVSGGPTTYHHQPMPTSSSNQCTGELGSEIEQKTYTVASRNQSSYTIQVPRQERLLHGQRFHDIYGEEEENYRV